MITLQHLQHKLSNTVQSLLFDPSLTIIILDKDAVWKNLLYSILYKWRISSRQ